MRVLGFLAAAALVAAPLAAQQPGAPRRQLLETRISEQFLENYRRQAGLTPEQFTRFRTIATRSFQQRRERQQRERGLWISLEMQMRPGVAAVPDSVNKLLDGIVALRLANVDQFKADDREYATFLSPVQRAQLFLATERLQRSIEDIRRRMQQAGGAPGEFSPEP
ncbi:MAG: hypothetical protein EXR93_07955 [Gemmatimonadetes bacterium]|nr:hypothetical protein [Gemmatimonadota bacterium]